MAKLSAWAVTTLDHAVRKFRKEVETLAQKIAEQRGERTAAPEDVEAAEKEIKAHSESATCKVGS